MHSAMITYNSQKGWYFAENLTDHSSVFVHASEIENERCLKVGDKISFDLIPNRKIPGKMCAGNVKFLGHVIAVQRSEPVVKP